MDAGEVDARLSEERLRARYRGEVHEPPIPAGAMRIFAGYKEKGARRVLQAHTYSAADGHGLV